MHVLRNVCVVHNFDGDGLALAHPQEGTGDFIAVADCADYNLRGQLDQHGHDLQGEIRRTPGRLRFQRHHQMLWRPRNLLEAKRLPKRGPQLGRPGRNHGGPSKPYKIPSLHAILIPIHGRKWLTSGYSFSEWYQTDGKCVPVACRLTASKGKKRTKNVFLLKLDTADVDRSANQNRVHGKCYS